jgi:hypothetical protein
MKNMLKYLLVDAERMLKDFGNKFIFISQSPYAGKTLEDGTVVIPGGARVTT